MKKKNKILTVVGARPNFIKIAPLFEELKRFESIRPILIHTGQHYDYELSRIFFQDLKIPRPDYNLGVGSGLHGEQTGKAIIKLEKICIKEKFNLGIVVGDVNSTLAGALVMIKLHVPLAHIEAGLRSFNLFMPEEVNRRLTDHVTDLLFCPTKTAVENLKKEGIKHGIYNVGDIMYDAFLKGTEIARRKSKILKKLNLKPRNYYLATVHRAENTDKRKRLESIVSAFLKIKNLILPCHPRTEKYLKQYRLWKKLNQKIKIIKSVGYIDMLWLEKNARKILTDSGGVQKEAYFSKVPCITLRDKTEWVETVKDGWNILADVSKYKILNAVRSFQPNTPTHKYFGSGNTARKIVKILCQKMKD